MNKTNLVINNQQIYFPPDSIIFIYFWRFLLILLQNQSRYCTISPFRERTGKQGQIYPEFSPWTALETSCNQDVAFYLFCWEQSKTYDYFNQTRPNNIVNQFNLQLTMRRAMSWWELTKQHFNPWWFWHCYCVHWYFHKYGKHNISNQTNNTSRGFPFLSIESKNVIWHWRFYSSWFKQNVGRNSPLLIRARSKSLFREQYADLLPTMC